MPNRMKCCVPGCKKSPRTSYYRFPKDEARCSIWVQRMNPSLSAKTIEQLHTLRVCGIHFTDNQYMNPKRIRLVHNAVPTLHLPTNRPINVSSVSGHSSSPRAQHSIFGIEPEVHESEHLSNPRFQYSTPTMGYEVHKTENLSSPGAQDSMSGMEPEVHENDSVPDAPKVSVEGLITEFKNEVDCIVDTPPSPCPESPTPPFTLHNDITNLQLDLDVLRRELKEGLATLSKKLRDRIDAIMVRVHQLILTCREDQKLAAAESNPTPEMELESQRLKRLSLYLSMVLTFLRKWKEDEVKEINRYIHIEQRMNWLNKLAIVVVNKDPNELEKALKIAENMT